LKRIGDEGDIAADAFVRAVELYISYRTEGLDTFQCGLGRSEVSESAQATEVSFKACMINLDVVVQVVPRHVTDLLFCPQSRIDLGNHFGIALRFVGDHRRGKEEALRLARLTQESLPSLGVASRCKAKVDELPLPVDCAPEKALRALR
jgi:hypothetical protein